MEDRESDHPSEEELDDVEALVMEYLRMTERADPAVLESFLRERVPPHRADRVRHTIDATLGLGTLLAAMADPTPASPESSSLPPGRSVGEYRIVSQLGSGGMGTVYLADQPSLSRQVALKVLHPVLAALPESRARFHREALAGAKLRHDGIAPIHVVGERDGLVFFAMDYVPGQSLADWLERPSESLPAFGPRSVGEKARLIAWVAEALEHAHSRGIIHRDVKPQNILLDTSGRPKLVDFGLAKEIDRPSETAPGLVLGTPYYMSPEQIEGRPGTVDHRTDVFSLGVVLYELLTGTRPFEGDGVGAIQRALLSKDPRRPRRLDPTLPRDLETVCLKALEKTPAQRYSSAAELAADLRRFLGFEAIHARPNRVVTMTVKWVRRHRGLALGLVVSAVLGAGLLSQIIQNRQAEQALSDQQVLLRILRTNLGGKALTIADARWLEERVPDAEARSMILADPLAEDSWRALEERLPRLRTPSNRELTLLAPRAATTDSRPRFVLELPPTEGRLWTLVLWLWPAEGDPLRVDLEQEAPPDDRLRLEWPLEPLAPGRYVWSVGYDRAAHPARSESARVQPVSLEVVDPKVRDEILLRTSAPLLRAAALIARHLAEDALNELNRLEGQDQPPEAQRLAALLRGHAAVLLADPEHFASARSSVRASQR